MAPTENEKRPLEEGEEEDPALKRVRVEGEEEEDFDEDDDEDFDQEDWENAFDDEMTVDDFAFEVTEDEVKVFNEAYHKFSDSIKADSQVLMLSKPWKIEPILKTVEDFQTKVALHYLTEEGTKYQEELDLKITELDSDFQEAMTALEEACGDNDDESSNPEMAKKMKESQDKHIKNQAGAFASTVDGLKQAFDKKEYDALVEKMIILTYNIFDEEIHDGLWSSDGPVEDVTKFITVLGDLWKNALALSDEQLKITEVQRKQFTTFLSTCADEVKAGRYCDEDEENVFKELPFNWQ